MQVTKDIMFLTVPSWKEQLLASLYLKSFHSEYGSGPNCQDRRKHNSLQTLGLKNPRTSSQEKK